MARILVGVSGGVAAYKVAQFVRLAVEAGHAVRVVQTPASLRFVGRSTFSAITGAPVLVSEFETDQLRGAFPGDDFPEHEPISHLALVERADAFLIAPATGNLLARLATGSSDDLICASALAARCPVIVAPAMNWAMWDNEATAHNVRTLRERGITVMEPGTGRLASKDESGKGRLPEPSAILAEVDGHLRERDLEGLNVLVTSGGTQEPIDPVRYIGNRSSGRMGAAIADAAAARGARVTSILANCEVRPGGPSRTVDVGTASELATQLEREFPQCDVLIMAAAVADFQPSNPSSEKIKKGQALTSIELVATRDLLADIATKRSGGQTLVGFAAEHGGDPLVNARGKLAAKGVDAIVLNDVSKPGVGFGSEDNEVTIVTPTTERHVGPAPKRAIADAVLDEVVLLRKG